MFCHNHNNFYFIVQTEKKISRSISPRKRESREVVLGGFKLVKLGGSKLVGRF